MLSFWHYAFYYIDDWQSWCQPVPVQCINSHPLKHFNLISLSLIHSCSSMSHLLLHCLHYKLIVIILVRFMVKHAVPEPNILMSVKNKTHKRFMASYKRHERIMTLDGWLKFWVTVIVVSYAYPMHSSRIREPLHLRLSYLYEITGPIKPQNAHCHMGCLLKGFYTLTTVETKLTS